MSPRWYVIVDVHRWIVPTKSERGQLGSDFPCSLLGPTKLVNSYRVLLLDQRLIVSRFRDMHVVPGREDKVVSRRSGEPALTGYGLVVNAWATMTPDIVLSVESTKRR